jgi:transposase-like protein
MAKQHRGEVVKEALLKSGVKITKLCQELGISRPTLYRRFEEPNLDFDFIKQVGQLIYHDFGQDFKELTAPAVSVAAEPTSSTRSTTAKTSSCMCIASTWSCRRSTMRC